MYKDVKCQFHKTQTYLHHVSKLLLTFKTKGTATNVMTFTFQSNSVKIDAASGRVLGAAAQCRGIDSGPRQFAARLSSLSTSFDLNCPWKNAIKMYLLWSLSVWLSKTKHLFSIDDICVLNVHQWIMCSWEVSKQFHSDKASCKTCWGLAAHYKIRYVPQRLFTRQ